jgi:hypothetical protein
MHHNQHTRSFRSSWVGSLVGLSTLALLMGGVSCSSEPGDGNGTIPPGTVVDSCPPGYTCETNADGTIVVVGADGSGGATSTGGVSSGGGAPSSSGGTPGTATGGAVSSGGGGGNDENCTDVQHPDQLDQPCSIWLEWGDPPGAHCNDDWLQGYCDATCGRCTPSSGSGGGNGSGGGGNGSGGWGNNVTLPDINNNSNGWGSRYWDCCKPHCAWSGADRGTVRACGADGTSELSDANAASACPSNNQSPGPAYMCYSQAPRAVSDTVSYGYVAASPGRTVCGKCYHIQFTGSSHNAGNDAGSAAIAGKHMIVQISNTGHDVGDNQLDLMIPGGGVGVNPNTCGAQWGLSNSDLGNQYGGFLADCRGDHSDHNSRKQCVRSRCDKLPAGDLRDGCYWFVDWFEIADNPNFKYEEIQCPADF